MKRTATPFRLAAFALSAVISTTLFATIVGSMPPDFDGSPNAARNAADPAARTEVAIVPSRIEVVGWRGDLAAAEGPRGERPRT